MKIRNLILLAFGLLPFWAFSQNATFDRVRLRQGLTIRSEKADSIIRAVTALSNHTSIPTAKAVWDAIAAIVAASKYQTLRDDGTDMPQRTAANFVSTSSVSMALTDDAGGETEIRATIPTGGVTTTELSDGTIANVDISSSANIANSKLANSGVTSGSYPSTGGSTVQFSVNSKGIITSATTIPLDDPSATNEGRLGVGAGSGSTSVITSNTSGANGVTIAAGTGIGISETTSSNGGTITISNTIADPSVATVADSAAFRAYSGSADVVILSDRDRGGKFRKCSSCTADQYMVFTDATAQKWERFDYGAEIRPEWFSAKSISGNDTRGWKLGLRYAAKVGLPMVLTSSYIVKDSVLMDRKFTLRGNNTFNQTATLNWVDFDISGNVPAIVFIPNHQYTQGPIITDCAFRDVSSSGSRHFLELYATVEDVRSCAYVELKNLQFRDFDRYAVFVNDCYVSTMNIENWEVVSCGGIVGVDMSETKLSTQSAGDTWTLSTVNCNGSLQDIVAQDTAILDVRDVSSVVITNVVIQGYVSSTCHKQLIWADHGNIEINKIYTEMTGPGVLSDFGKFGSADNPNCSIELRGFYCSLGSAYANKTFKVYGPTSVRAYDIEFGSSANPYNLFTPIGTAKRNISIQNFITQDRPGRVDIGSYQDDLTWQGTATDLLYKYPSEGQLIKIGSDTLFGPTGYGNMALFSGGPYTRVIDAEKGKVHKLVSTGSRIAFTLDLALPTALRGKLITVSMTYKYTVSDSTTSGNRWALSNGFQQEYTTMARLQLGRWTVATDAFIYPVGTTSTQLVFGDVAEAFPTANAEMLISDITIRFGRQLLPEAPAKPDTKKDLIFRKNISGVNASGFLDGDLVATEHGLYLKKSGAFELIGGATGTVTGTGTANQLAYWNGSSAITGSSGFTVSGSNLLVGPSGGDHVEIIPGTSEISLFNSGIVDARMFANDGGGIETNVGIKAGGNSEVVGTLNVSGHFLAPGISSGPSGTPTTPAGTYNAWSATGSSPYISFSESGIANRGAFGFPASSGDFLWTVGNQVLSSGTERMRLTNSGRLGVGASSPGAGFHLRGTGVGTQIFLENITSTTGKNWYVSSLNGGNLVLGNPTTADALTINGTTGAVSVANTLTVGSATGTAASIAGLTSGGVVTTATIGSGLSLSGGTLSATGGATDLGFTGTSSPVTLTSSTGADVTITAGGINSLSATGTNLTITATELQTFANTSDPTSHTVTITNTGGSVQFVEGSGITLTTTGTSGAGVVTIAASGGGGGSPSVETLTEWTSDQDNVSINSATTTLRVSGDNGIRGLTSINASGMTSGREFNILNVGTHPVVIQAQHPDGSAANKFDILQDVVLAPKSSCRAIYDGTSTAFRVIADAATPQKKFGRNVVAGSITAGDWGEIDLVTSGGTITDFAANSDVPSAFSLNTSTSATGKSYILGAKTVNALFRSGYGYLYYRAVVTIPTLSTGTQHFLSYNGLLPSANSTNEGGGNYVVIQYRHDLNGGRWEGWSASNADIGMVDLGVTVVAGTPYTLEIYLNKQRTEARYYIDGVYRGRRTTLLPDNATIMRPTSGIHKISGTTSRSVYVHELEHWGVMSN